MRGPGVVGVPGAAQPGGAEEEEGQEEARGGGGDGEGGPAHRMGRAVEGGLKEGREELHRGRGGAEGGGGADPRDEAQVLLEAPVWGAGDEREGLAETHDKLTPCRWGAIRFGLMQRSRGRRD